MEEDISQGKSVDSGRMEREHLLDETGLEHWDYVLDQKQSGERIVNNVNSVQDKLYIEFDRTCLIAKEG